MSETDTVTRLSYLVIRPKVPGPHEKPRKTKVWTVEELPGVSIGTISWKTSWRCYVFSPDVPGVYESTCMSELSDFLKFRTAEQRLEAKERKR